MQVRGRDPESITGRLPSTTWPPGSRADIAGPSEARSGPWDMHDRGAKWRRGGPERRRVWRGGLLAAGPVCQAAALWWAPSMNKVTSPDQGSQVPLWQVH